ncbi:MAG: hypothetical protein EBR02_08825 [Alphaproteobacteria bacterium]|nr:hypothetical protein [Alphaproteobacteria bacterium]
MIAISTMSFSASLTKIEGQSGAINADFMAFFPDDTQTASATSITHHHSRIDQNLKAELNLWRDFYHSWPAEERFSLPVDDTASYKQSIGWDLRQGMIDFFAQHKNMFGTSGVCANSAVEEVNYSANISTSHFAALNTETRSVSIKMVKRGNEIQSFSASLFSTRLGHVSSCNAPHGQREELAHFSANYSREKTIAINLARHFLQTSITERLVKTNYYHADFLEFTPKENKPSRILLNYAQANTGDTEQEMQQLLDAVLHSSARAKEQLHAA